MYLWYRYAVPQALKVFCTTNIQKGEGFDMDKRVKPIRLKKFWA